MPTRPMTDEERRRIGGRTGEPAGPNRPTIGRPDLAPGYVPGPRNPNRIYPPGHIYYRPPPGPPVEPEEPVVPEPDDEGPGAPARPLKPTIFRPDKEPGYRKPPSGAAPGIIGQDPSFGPTDEEGISDNEYYARLVQKQDSGGSLTREERQFLMEFEKGRQGTDRIVGGTMGMGSMPMGPSFGGRGALHIDK